MGTYLFSVCSPGDKLADRSNADTPGSLVCEKEVFFSEEKKQKTFMSLSRFSPAVHAYIIEVSGCFFKKRTASRKMFRQ
jgi:hypothetical protein